MSQETSIISNSSDISLLRIFQADQLIDDWQQHFRINIAQELQGHPKIYLYRCNQTQLKFFAPADIAGSGKLYEQLQKFDWYYMPHKWEHRIAQRDLKKCQKILEIGSAYGDFVKTCIEAGLDIKGIELNEAAVDVAQKRQLPVERLDLQEAAEIYHESLDGVCSFQVLEHVPNPKEFIEWSIEMLKPGGKLVYCVPNAESFLQHQYNLLDMPPHHMTLWTKSSFKALEKLFPIKLAKVIYEPLAAYHTAAYVNAYSDRFRSRFPGSRLIFNRLSNSIYEKCLSLGLRNFILGQSLYVQFYKI
ncbi:MAG: class I SAM-dependent methyltransferase [Cyanophyceae cyanobacterium]